MKEFDDIEMEEPIKMTVSDYENHMNSSFLINNNILVENKVNNHCSTSIHFIKNYFNSYKIITIFL